MPFKDKEMQKIYMSNYELSDKRIKYCTEKLTCLCGSVVCRSSMSDHKKTKTHEAYIKANPVEDLPIIEDELNTEINPTKIKCICGRIISKEYMSQHKKTKWKLGYCGSFIDWI